MGAVLLRQDGSPVCERCLLAETPLTRLKGLLGRRGLEQGEGLLLRPAASIHTFFMRFAIDVAFAARDGRIVKVCSAVPARRLCIAWRGFAAIELAAGSLSAAGVTVGDFVCVNPASR